MATDIEPGRWRALTAQIGDRTFNGAFRTAGLELEVVGADAERKASLRPDEDAVEAAARLLVEIYAAKDPTIAPDGLTPIRTKAEVRPNSGLGIALFVAWLASGAALHRFGEAGPWAFLFVMLGWILAVMAHEFAHAGVAYLGGDHTVRGKGYLSFDPRRYGDVGTTLVIPILALALGGIGFPGGAVYLRPDLMRNRFWRAAASLAGPGATLLVLLALCYGLALASRAAVPGPLYDAVALLAFLQATALVLNLLPIPGLDGFNAIRPFLPRSWAPAIRKGEGLAMVLLLICLFVVPGFGRFLFGVGATITTAFGVPRDALQAGWDAFHFWR